MDAFQNKSKGDNTKLGVHRIPQRQGKGGPVVHHVDNRFGIISQRKLVSTMSDRPGRQLIIQKKDNRTGLPDTLKSGIENLSGHAMDDVKVHYNSSKPAQLNAHAYAQGNQIHLASGQEKHLPHEAWHVVQQKQGRVRPTLQLRDKTPVNDDVGLENEADVMGMKALQMERQTKEQKMQDSMRVVDGTVQSRTIGFQNKITNRGFGLIDNRGDSVIQKKPIKKAVTGITHLVELVHGSLYNEKHNSNVYTTIGAGDEVKINSGKRYRSRRGPNQEIYSVEDKRGPQHYLWYQVISLNRHAVPANIYIREDTITDYRQKGAIVENLEAKITEAPAKAAFYFTKWKEKHISLGTYLDKIHNLNKLYKNFLYLAGRSKAPQTNHLILKRLIEDRSPEIVQYLKGREDVFMLDRLLENERFPQRSRDILYSCNTPEEAINRLDTTLGGVEEWLLLNEDIGHKDSFGTRFDIMDEIAKVLSPFLKDIQHIIPGARLKYRGSLVRGLKGYPKGGIPVNTKAYDCDAFIEVPSKFWLDMRDKGAKGIERDEHGKPTGQTIDIRGYEPLDQISFPKSRKGQEPYVQAMGQLLRIEERTKRAIIHAQKSGRLKGYKYEDGKIDFEFYIRPEYNTTTTFHDGNPYLKGQVAARGFAALEQEKGMSSVPEFEKKKSNPEKADMLGPYVESHGSMGVIMPEYQAVIEEDGWYLETEALMEWRLLKRQVDSDQDHELRYPRTALPHYRAKMLPDFDRALRHRPAPEVEEHDKIYDTITQPEVTHFSVEIKNLNVMMSSIKIFDSETNILSLKEPKMIEVIIQRREALKRDYFALIMQYPELKKTAIDKSWREIFFRVKKKISEAIELRDTYGGSRKIVRDHSREKGRRK